MPHTSGGRWYAAPESAPRADFGHTYIGSATTTNGAAFATEDALVLHAQAQTHAYLVTALTGTHNDLTYIQRAAGAAAVSVEYIDPSANDAALSIAVTSNKITVNLATGPAGAITSTAAQIKAAIEAHSTARTKAVVQLATGNNGTGVVIALAETPLNDIGGSTPTVNVKLQTSYDASTWYDVPNAAFPEISTLSAGVKRAFGGALATYCRWAVVTGGGSPIVGVSVVGVTQTANHH